MKRVIRFCVPETNSSASHSLVILSEDDAKKWENGEYYAVKDFFPSFWKSNTRKPEKGKLYTQKEALDILAENHNGYIEDEYDSVDDFLAEEGGFVTYEKWEEIDLEREEESFTTPSGDKMVAYSVYGYDY